MNYLETLVAQWLDHRGYFVRTNVNVGRIKRGGFSGELDIAAYNPVTDHCLHVECSGDAGSWKDREKRFERKFEVGREFMHKEVFTWLKRKEIEQWVVVFSAGPDHAVVGGGKVVTMRRLFLNITTDIVALERLGNRVFPEKHFLLRAVQDTVRYTADRKQIASELSEGDRLLPRLDALPDSNALGILSPA
ncbi:MAG TPA: hypothetical protein VFE47_23505 [Tepidisphaeraceae bacterium]|jgi:hypothetical protein|nr:hypothetical protein [Tepidisphaeraceae bacterium]